MKLPYTLQTFSKEEWELVFGAFVKANRSHWRGAPYDAVVNLLRTKGRFEFSVTGMDTWTCKLLIVVLDDGALDASFVPNTELPAMMHKHLAQMQQTFEDELRKTRSTP